MKEIINNPIYKSLFFMWVIILSVGFLDAITTVAAEPNETIIYVSPIKKESSENIIVINSEYDEMPDAPFVENKPETNTEYSYSVGDYTITAYCCCEKCCGNWSGSNKTKDGIIGAEGTVLKEGTSVAAWLPLGTKISVDGKEYVVQDRTSKWIKEKYNSKIIDVYFENHNEALEFGKHISKVYIIKEP